MTTAMMVRDWENHCEQTEYSAYEATKAYDASQDLVIATRKIREALEHNKVEVKPMKELV